jgi:hypothetical protein
MATWDKIFYNCYDNIIYYSWGSFIFLTILRNKFESFKKYHQDRTKMFM